MENDLCNARLGQRISLKVKSWVRDFALWLVIGFSLVITAQEAFAQSTESPPNSAPQTQAGSALDSAKAQNPTPATPSEGGRKHDFSKTHIFWVIPNYRSDESGVEVKPLTPGGKFKVAFDDSFDPSAFLVAGVFAGMSMAERQYSQFGQGAQGFGKYYGGAFADQAIGNIMTEALFPIALHQDPRYFTKGKGGFWKRTAYAISREFVTRADDGRDQFNTSELAGNFVAAGISNAYYPPQDRSFPNTVIKWGQQIALDTSFNIMKEFWPDIRHKLFRR